MSENVAKFTVFSSLESERIKGFVECGWHPDQLKGLRFVCHARCQTDRIKAWKMFETVFVVPSAISVSASFRIINDGLCPIYQYAYSYETWHGLIFLLTWQDRTPPACHQEQEQSFYQFVRQWMMEMNKDWNLNASIYVNHSDSWDKINRHIKSNQIKIRARRQTHIHK